MSDVHDDRVALFANLESAEKQPKIWVQAADDVDWTRRGHTRAVRSVPLEGRLHSRHLRPPSRRASRRGDHEGRHLYVGGDTTVAGLRSTSKTNEGATFANKYCWVCRFDGDTIVEARAYPRLNHGRLHRPPR